MGPDELVELGIAEVKSQGSGLFGTLIDGPICLSKIQVADDSFRDCETGGVGSCVWDVPIIGIAFENWLSMPALRWCNCRFGGKGVSKERGPKGDVFLFPDLEAGF